MSQYPKPILHNGTLNTSFNTSDFTSTSKLNSTTVSGPLVVAGLGTFNAGLQVYGGLVVPTATISSTLSLGASSTVTLPSTQVLNNTTTLVDLGTVQNITGAKQFSSIKTALNTVINASNDVVDTTNIQIITGAKTFSNNITLTSTTAPTTTGTQLGSSVSGTMTATTAYTTAVSFTVGSVVLANAGTYIIYGQGGIQCTTAGSATLAGVSLNAGSAVINNLCYSQTALTAVVGFYPLQVVGTFTVTANTTIYLVSNLTFATGAFSSNQSYSTLKAVRIA